MIVILNPDCQRILAFKLIFSRIFLQYQQAARADRQAIDVVFHRFALHAFSAATDPAFAAGH
ncbi:hypothetical protein D3C78_1532520 [compost metagenome]